MRAVLVLLFIVAGSGCAGSLKQEIHTEDVNENDITGTYSLIFCSGWYEADRIAVALLGNEDSPYSLEPYGPDFDCSTLRHLAAKEALARAYNFERSNPDFAGAQFSRILDGSGGIVGYEMRPLYLALRYGAPDIYDIYYWRRDDKVLFRIWIPWKVTR